MAKPTFLLVLLIVVTGAPAILYSRASVTDRSSPKETPVAVLTAKEEAALRKAVYEGDFFTALPTKGQYAFRTIMVLPKHIEEEFTARKVRPALAVLLEIVKGGRSDDASVAAGYAYVLSGDRVWAVVAANNSSGKRFDDKQEALGCTPRQKLVKEVQALLAAAK